VVRVPLGHGEQRWAVDEAQRERLVNSFVGFVETEVAGGFEQRPGGVGDPQPFAHPDVAHVQGLNRVQPGSIARGGRSSHDADMDVELVVAGDHLPHHERVAVTDQRPRRVGKRRRCLPPEVLERRMPDEVDTSVDRSQPPLANEPADCVAVNAARQQLGMRDQPALVIGDLEDRRDEFGCQRRH
jgi:hypothetical protein